MVLGATGGIGGETALALSRHGWKIRAFSRTTSPSLDLLGWEWVKGDALNQASVLAASEGVHAIVHAVNPPGYRNWAKLVLPMIDNTIAAAQSSGARILPPGTIYNYGPDAFPVLREESPQNATTQKGRIRIELEKRLEDASRQGVRSLIVRFGDFFGPKPGNNWFSQAIVSPNRPLKSITYPGVSATIGLICPLCNASPLDGADSTGQHSARPISGQGTKHGSRPGSRNNAASPGLSP